MPVNETSEQGGPDSDGNHAESHPTRRVVFIGGLDDGRRTVEELRRRSRVDLVGVFVLDDESGSRVSGFRTFDDLVEPPVLRKIAKIRRHPGETGSTAILGNRGTA